MKIIKFLMIFNLYPLKIMSEFLILKVLIVFWFLVAVWLILTPLNMMFLEIKKFQEKLKLKIYWKNCQRKRSLLIPFWLEKLILSVKKFWSRKNGRKVKGWWKKKLFKNLIKNGKNQKIHKLKVDFKKLIAEKS